MDQDKARAALRKHGSVRAAARALGIPYSTLNKRLHSTSKKPKQDVGKPLVQRSGRSLKEFRERYDKNTIVPQKVKEALKALGPNWESETNFAKIAGVSLGDLSAYRDMFAAHIVTIKRDGSKRVWAGTVKVAEEMRAML